MPLLTNITNFGKAAQKLKILLDLEERTNKNTLLGHSFMIAINNRIPTDEIIQYVKDCIRDNKYSVTGVIGEDLTQRIEEYKF